MSRARKEANGQKMSKKLALARQAEVTAFDLAEEVRILVEEP